MYSHYLKYIIAFADNLQSSRLKLIFHLVFRLRIVDNTNTALLSTIHKSTELNANTVVVGTYLTMDIHVILSLLHKYYPE